MFKIVENKTVTENVITQVQDMIMSGELKCGDKLPPERDLIQMLHISRPALREALKQLEVLGLTESRQGQGTFIVNNVGQSFFKPLSLSFKLYHGDPKNILDIRLLLETYCCCRAAREATDEEISEYQAIHEQIRSLSSLEDISELDRKFHRLLIQNSGNPLIVLIYESMSYLLDSFITQGIYLSSSRSNVVAEINEEHEALISAIKDHDEQKALEAIQRHIGNVSLDLFPDTLPDDV